MLVFFMIRMGAAVRRIVNRSGLIFCVAVLLGGAPAVTAGQAAAAAAVRSAHTRPGATAARTDLASASAANTVGQLKAVAAVSRDDVWAVGCSGSCNGPDSLILHWNGSRWAKVASPDPGPGFDELTGVTAVSARDVWAVGYACNAANCLGTAGIFRTLIVHWNGAKWSVVASPDPSTVSNLLSGVSAVSADNVWAAGSYDPDPATLQSGPLILHWNGTKWSKVASPGLNDALTPTLYGISAHSATNAWAVGSVCPDGGCPSFRPSTDTLILRWNGTRWSKVASPSPGPFNSVLFAVSAVRADDAWAVGDLTKTAGGGDRALIEHWNGTKWSQVTAANPSSSFNDLQAVSASSARDIWAVGDQLGAALPYTTLTERRTCTTWSAVASPNKTTSTYGANVNFLAGVAAISPTDAVAVGWAQTFTGSRNVNHVMILTWNGTKWSIA
jgi:hypothetical protein